MKPSVNVELGADGSIQSAETTPEFDGIIDSIIRKHGGKVNRPRGVLLMKMEKIRILKGGTKQNGDLVVQGDHHRLGLIHERDGEFVFSPFPDRGLERITAPSQQAIIRRLRSEKQR